MFSTLRSRLWLTYAMLVTAALTIVAVIYFVYLWRNPFVFRQEVSRMATVQSHLLDQQAGWVDQPVERIQEKFQQQDANFNVRLLLLADAKTVLADSRQGTAPELILRRVPLLTQSSQVRDAAGQTWLFRVRRMDDGRYLMAAVPRPKVSLLAILTDELLPPLWQGGLLALVLALIFAYFMARWVADPLQRVVQAAAVFPQGESSQLPLDGPREVQELVSAFNQMTNRVQSSQRSQRDFVANVSHELKTPLTSIQGFSQALLDGTADTSEARQQAAEVIHAEAERMYRMVLDLLELARLDSGIARFEPAPLELVPLLEAVIQRFTPQAARDGVVLALVAESVPSISADGERLAQVFNNLVDNALKFTPREGRVTISLRPDAAGVSVDVADSGSGIPAEALPHIFDRFYQSDPSRRGGERHGAGLGLAIAQEIIRMHGGKISVHSTPEQGTVFTVKLPLANSDASTIIRKRS